MSGINYLRELPGRVREWRRFRKLFPAGIVKLGKIPSETYVKYPPDTQFNGKRVLNLGCGKCVYLAPNVVNLDAVTGNGVNVVHDLAVTPLPFDSASFDFIIANHVLEHIPNWWNLFQELARILKPGGMLEIWIPPVSGDSAFTYRDHINSIGILSFAGTHTARQAGTNLVVGAENLAMSDAAQMELIRHSQRPYMKWWLQFAPHSVLEWCTTHLRHTISEEGFLFRKVSNAD